MNKKILKVLVVSALLNCGISSFIATPYVEAKELKPSINQSIEHQKQKLEFKLYDEIQDAITILDNNEDIAPGIIKNIFRSKINSAFKVYLDKNSDISRYEKAIDSLKLYKKEFKGRVSKLIKEKKNSANTQVNYQVKYIDDTTGEEIYDTITKIAFSNETVTEEAKQFDGYRLISKNNQSKTLSKGNNDPIIFRYVKEVKNKDFKVDAKIQKAIDKIQEAISNSFYKY